MNRFVNRFLACLMVAACLFSSCRKEDDWRGKTENPNPEKVVVPDSYILRSTFLELDQDGNVETCYFGSSDPAQPGVVSITVRKLQPVQWAREFMKSIIPDDADITETEDQLVWNLKDVQGKAEGQMVFKPSDAVGQFAVVEVPESARPLKQIVFKKPLLTDNWMDEYNQCEALDAFYLGAPVEVKKGKLPEGSSSDFGHGEGKFLVIRDYEAGVQNGLLLRLETEEYNYTKFIVDFYSRVKEQRERAMRYPEARLVHKLLKNNSVFAQTMISMGMASWDNGFLFYTPTGKEDDDWFVSEDVRINFKTGEMDSLAFLNAWYYREAWLYKFYVREENGSLKVFIDSNTYGTK